MLAKLYHYGVSISGQLSQAVFNFGLFFVLLGFLSPSEIGLYSFIMMVTGLSGSLCNAATATQVTVYQNPAASSKTTLYNRMFFQVSVLIALAVGLATATVAVLLYHDDFVGLPIFAFAFLYFMRHFKRAYEFARLRHQMASATDILYVAAGALMTWAYYIHAGTIHMPALFAILAAAEAVSILPGTEFRRVLATSFGRSYLRLYGKIWRSDTRWNLLGVTTAEVTANIHSYLVMAIKGPAAFAPITSAQMPYRGIGIVQTALGSFERPRLTHAYAAGDWRTAAAIRRFYVAFVGVSLAVLVAGALFFWDWIFVHVYKSKFDEGLLYIMFLLWAGVNVVRTFSSFLHVELQAMLAFQALGRRTGYAALVSTVAALALLLLYGTAASIAGVLIGETVLLVLLLRARNACLAERRTTATPLQESA